MLIDVTRSVNRALSGKLPTGIDRVCLAYLKNYAKESQGVVWAYGRYHVLSTKSTQSLCKQLHGNSGRITLVLGLGICLIKDWLIVPDKGDVFLQLGHSGLENECLALWIRKHNLKLFSMVHDLIPVTHPEFTRVGMPALHAKRVKNMLHLSTGILANSQFTLDQLRDYANTHELPMPATNAIHLPPAELTVPAKSPPLSTPYFVMLGTIEPRKNHVLILEVWRKLIANLGDRSPKLVIIGQRGWSCNDVLAQLDHDVIFKPHVIELGRCPDSELSTWIAHANALLFPSHIEGYGIPLVEAMMLGTPIIASNLEVFHEISGDIPKHLDPDNVKVWFDAIKEFSKPHSQIRAVQQLALKSYHPPSWNTYFKQVETFIEQQTVCKQ